MNSYNGLLDILAAAATATASETTMEAAGTTTASTCAASTSAPSAALKVASAVRIEGARATNNQDCLKSPASSLTKLVATSSPDFSCRQAKSDRKTKKDRHHCPLKSKHDKDKHRKTKKKNSSGGRSSKRSKCKADLNIPKNIQFQGGAVDGGSGCHYYGRVTSSLANSASESSLGNVDVKVNAGTHNFNVNSEELQNLQVNKQGQDSRPSPPYFGNVQNNENHGVAQNHGRITAGINEGDTVQGYLNVARSSKAVENLKCNTDFKNSSPSSDRSGYKKMSSAYVAIAASNKQVEGKNNGDNDEVVIVDTVSPASGISDNGVNGSKFVALGNNVEWKPFVFGNYVDRSQEPDTIPNTPLTTPNRCPSFIVKLYAVLSHHPELSHVITWLPHGRSWTILDPVEFEVEVLPKHFGSGVSLVSFTKRVTKIWGFERLASDISSPGKASKSSLHKSYFHEYFLRGKPHLTKKMTPAADQKAVANNSTTSSILTEADLKTISQRRPLAMNATENTQDESVVIMQKIDEFIMENGPATRVPVSLCHRHSRCRSRAKAKEAENASKVGTVAKKPDEHSSPKKRKVDASSRQKETKKVHAEPSVKQVDILSRPVVHTNSGSASADAGAACRPNPGCNQRAEEVSSGAGNTPAVSANPFSVNTNGFNFDKIQTPDISAMINQPSASRISLALFSAFQSNNSSRQDQFVSESARVNHIAPPPLLQMNSASNFPSGNQFAPHSLCQMQSASNFSSGCGFAPPHHPRMQSSSNCTSSNQLARPQLRQTMQSESNLSFNNIRTSNHTNNCNVLPTSSNRAYHQSPYLPNQERQQQQIADLIQQLKSNQSNSGSNPSLMHPPRSFSSIQSEATSFNATHQSSPSSCSRQAHTEEFLRAVITRAFVSGVMFGSNTISGNDREGSESRESSSTVTPSASSQYRDQKRSQGDSSGLK